MTVEERDRFVTVGLNLRAASDYTNAPQVMTRPERRVHRRELVRALWDAKVSAGWNPPTLAELVQRLADDHGMHAAPTTLSTDLKALGLWPDRVVSPEAQLQLAEEPPERTETAV